MIGYSDSVSMIVRSDWSLFGYTHSKCDCDVEIERECQRYPMQFPFKPGDLGGQFLGWIDEYISTLTFLVRLVMKEHDDGKFCVIAALKILEVRDIFVNAMLILLSYLLDAVFNESKILVSENNYSFR